MAATKAGRADREPERGRCEPHPKDRIAGEPAIAEVKGDRRVRFANDALGTYFRGELVARKIIARYRCVARARGGSRKAKIHPAQERSGWRIPAPVSWPTVPEKDPALKANCSLSREIPPVDPLNRAATGIYERSLRFAARLINVEKALRKMLPEQNQTMITAIGTGIR